MQAALQVGTFIVLRLVGQNADELASEFPVIPTRETIEESIGFRRIESLTPDPVAHLLTKPHTNNLANSAAAAFLHPLQDVIDGRRRITSYNSNIDVSLELSRDRAKEIINLINEFLYTVMERGEDLTHETIASRAADIFIKLALSCRYPFPAMAQGVMERLPLFKTALAAWLMQAARAVNPADYITRTNALPWNIVIGAEHKRLSDIANDSLNARWKDQRYKAHYDQRTRVWLSEEKQKYTAEVRQA